MVSSAGATTAKFLENTNGPAFFYSQAAVSGSNSQTFEIASGNYVLIQFLSINGTGADVWSQMSVGAKVSLIDPPREAPEGRWTALVAIAVLFIVCLALRRARLSVLPQSRG
jgi:hypothetical protein